VHARPQNEGNPSQPGQGQDTAFQITVDVLPISAVLFTSLLP